MSANLVIFTDLDGTLLDQTTYSFEPAREALELLRKRKIPVIFCSSKTRAEIETLRRKLKNEHPFVVENGGAVFIPKGYFSAPPENSREVGLYMAVELGSRYDELRCALKRIREETGLTLLGFGDLAVDEIVARTGLSREEAELAAKREYDEPFLSLRPLSPGEEKKLTDAVRRHGLKLTRGGLFYHLTGDADKGRAVRMLTELFARDWGRPLVSVALGDSPNDLPMLQAVDVPVLVQKPDGSYDPVVTGEIPVRLAPGPGPNGWNAAVLSLVEELA